MLTSCSRCDGIGVVIQPTGFFDSKIAPCPRCSGAGTVAPNWFQRLYHRFQLWLERLVGRGREL